MKNLKLAKYNIKSSFKPIIIYYCILITVITCLAILNKFSAENNESSGIEFSSMIFLFVIGLNFFKENFHFTQANNISRADYLKSVVIAILPIALVMSILDVIINRVFNLSMVCPTFYDMTYAPGFINDINKRVWIQSNSIGTLSRTVTFLFASYIVVFALGLLITMIYYKCNKIMRILVSLSPIVIIAIGGIIFEGSSKFENNVVDFFMNIFGLNTFNSYMAVMTLICLFIILMTFVYMLVRKAVVKRT